MRLAAVIGARPPGHRIVASLCRLRRCAISSVAHFVDASIGVKYKVGVEMIIADHPLHRSGRAALPHPAPTLGDNAQALGRIRVADAGGGKPVGDQGRHSAPRQVIALTTSTQHPPPQEADRPSEGTDRGAIHRDAVVAHVTENDRAQVFAHRWDRLVHATLEFRFHIPQLRLPPFAHRLAQHRVRSVLPSSRFPLVRPLPSIASAAAPSALFGDFAGTTGRSDFPSAFIVGSGLSTARHALSILRSQRPKGSPGSRAKCIRTCVGSLTAQGPEASRQNDALSFAFRLSPRRRHPEVTRLVAGHVFRSSIPSLYVPLPTLHRRPYGRQCMTRGQCGWLDPHCIKLSFTTLCRFNRRTEKIMTKYLIEASYTAEGLKGLQKDKASGRKQAVTKLLEGLEGKLEAMYFAMGEHDVILIVDVPDIVTGAALSLGVSATGLVRTKSTALLTVEETDRALAKKVNYRAPGE